MCHVRCHVPPRRNPLKPSTFFSKFVFLSGTKFLIHKAVYQGLKCYTCSHLVSSDYTYPAKNTVYLLEGFLYTSPHVLGIRKKKCIWAQDCLSLHSCLSLIFQHSRTFSWKFQCSRAFSGSKEMHGVCSLVQFCQEKSLHKEKLKRKHVWLRRVLQIKQNAAGVRCCPSHCYHGTFVCLNQP